MKRKNDFVVKKVGEEILLVPIGSQVMDLNGLVTLNNTAAYIWDLLANDCTSQEITSAVAKEFDVDVAKTEKDVQVFIKDIKQIGLLEN